MQPVVTVQRAAVFFKAPLGARIPSDGSEAATPRHRPECKWNSSVCSRDVTSPLRKEIVTRLYFYRSERLVHLAASPNCFLFRAS